MVMYNKFRNLGKIVKNNCGPVITNRGTSAFFLTGTIAACFHKLRKVFWDKLRLKNKPENSYKPFRRILLNKIRYTVESN
jgi:hypothetical protein